MNTFGERLRMLLEHEKVNIRPSQLAAKANKPRQTISNYLFDRSQPDFNFLNSLIEIIPNANLKWLITGHGEMFEKPQSDEGIDTLKRKLYDLETREKQLTDTIIRMGTMIGGVSSQPGQQSKSKGVFVTGNFLQQHTVVNTPWQA